MTVTRDECGRSDAYLKYVGTGHLDADPVVRSAVIAFDLAMEGTGDLGRVFSVNGDDFAKWSEKKAAFLSERHQQERL